jgi:hypothetical protein
MKRAIIALGAALLAGCSPEPGSDADAAARTADAAASTAEAAVADAEAALKGAGDGETETLSGPASQWTYESTDNAMGDGKTALACVESENEANLGFPYGSPKARLCLRKSPQHGKDAYVALLGDGQILCQSYEPCKIRVRYGDQPARTVNGIGASDHSSNIVFFSSYDPVAQGVKSADKTAVEIEFYQAGRQALIFPTKGLEWTP